MNFKQCDQSSYSKGNWKCHNGLNGKSNNTEGSMWASKSEGIGAWVSVEFKALYQITKLKFTNRRNPAERNSLIVATFSNGQDFEMKLKNLDEVQKFKIDQPIIVTSVKFKIKGVYGAINNGGSIKVFGTKCVWSGQATSSPSQGIDEDSRSKP